MGPYGRPRGLVVGGEAQDKVGAVTGPRGQAGDPCQKDMRKRAHNYWPPRGTVTKIVPHNYFWKSHLKKQ